ncbi:hypothetical protein HY004_01085 [Candidatus Saccharibacteria bacterium]|nr:hypothetical protein [Candidatus Saccharibacteria bacterium]
MSTKFPSGSQGNYVPELSFLVYTQSTDNSVKVYLDSTSLNCNDFVTIRAWQVTNDDTTGWSTPSIQAPDDLNNASQCDSSGGRVVLTVPGSDFWASQKFGDSYKTTEIQLKLDSSPPRSGTFYISASDGTGDKPKLGFIGARQISDPNIIKTNSGWLYSEYAPSITLDGGSPREIEVEFGPPCDQTINSANVTWKDADSGTPPNGGQQVEYAVFEKLRGHTNWSSSPVAGWADAGSSKNAFYSSANFDAVQKRSYKVSFNAVSAATSNTIQILLPFDQAGYARPCKPPQDTDGWNATFSNTEVQGGNSNGNTTVGDVTAPNTDDAPQPGHTFKYVNTITNNGQLSMTGPFTTTGDSYTDGSFFYLHFGYKAGATAPYTGSDLYGNTAGRIHIRNAVNDNKTGENYASNYEDKWAGYTTAANSDVGDPWSNNYGSFTVGQGDGGRVRCITTSFNPTSGKRDADSPYDAPNGASFAKNEKWTYDDGPDVSTLCVNIPWYYTLSADLTVTGASSSTLQQGQALEAKGKISNPNVDGSGRLHTNSQSKDMGVIELKLDPGQPVISNIAGVPNTANYATGPCDHMKSRSGGNGLCDPQGDGDKAVGAGSSEDVVGGRSANDTSNYSVGTKLCYAAYAKHPRNTTSTEYDTGDSYYTYSDINCTVIVKSPKVHFQNTDVTVGRHRSTVDNPCSNPIGASIVTSSAPTIKDDGLAGNGNMYGSWVEYGAFATGSISGFGSAATPHGFVNNAIVQPQRLTFGNDGALGNFAAYGQTLNCLPNPFEDVNDSNTTDLEHLPTADAQNSFETAGINKGNLYLNELAEKTTASSDKKGYVAKGSNIRLTPRSPTTYTADVSVEAKPYLYGAECPRLNVTIYVSGVVTDSKPLDYCNDTNYETQTVNLGLGSVGYGGPSKVRLEYVNDYWIGGDRNIEVRNVNVKFNNNNTQQAHNIKDLPVSNRVYDTYDAHLCENASTITPGGGVMFQQSSASSAVGKNGACYGVEIFRSPDLPNIASMPPPPNLLNSAYTGFQSRDMVLYAKKADPTKKCTDVANATSGNIVIDQDIIYSRTGFNSVLQLPRLAFIADCSITISDTVREVYASLVAGDAIKTCPHQAKTKDECNQNLVVRGGISANRLLLWRTFGADLQNDDGAGTPAENFDLSPSQMIANYKRGLRSATFSTTSESDLPPRY